MPLAQTVSGHENRAWKSYNNSAGSASDLSLKLKSRSGLVKAAAVQARRKRFRFRLHVQILACFGMDTCAHPGAGAQNRKLSCMERLQKVIAQSGVCSRRKAEELILAGKVKVNGQKVTTLGTRVSAQDQISVNGKIISKEEKVYYVLNKPKGCVTTVKDDKDRDTVMNYVPAGTRVFPVGRLDYDTSGVLLLTNDGRFANQMMHPRYHLPKTYEINLQGMLSEEDIRKLRRGFSWKGETFGPAKVFIRNKDYARDRMLVSLTIYEGHNHQVKNMMEALGHHVRKLHRASFGFVTVQDLRPGECRRLKPFDVRRLMAMAEEKQ